MPGRLLAVVAVVGMLAGCRTSTDHDLVIANVSIVDVDSGDVVPGQDIFVADGVVTQIANHDSTSVSSATEVIDGTGLFAMPGLFDMHVHALWDSTVARSFLPAFTRWGVTTVRDMGGDLSVWAGVRATPDSVSVHWPRIYASGSVIDGPAPVDPSISIAAGTREEGVAAVDSLAASGADFVKVYTLLPRDAFEGVLSRAGELGLAVVGHVPGEVSVREAIDLGMLGIEHLRDEIEPFCHGITEAECVDLIARMRERGVHNTPTLAVLRAKTLRGYGATPTESVHDLPEIVQDYWISVRDQQSDRSEEYFARRSKIFEEELGLAGLLSQEDAIVVAGSDTGNPFIRPGESLHRELELLVQSGMTPWEAIRSATVIAAQVLEIDDELGKIATGFAADIVLVRTNPLVEISNTRDIAGVVIRGEYVD